VSKDNWIAIGLGVPSFLVALVAMVFAILSWNSTRKMTRTIMAQVELPEVTPQVQEDKTAAIQAISEEVPANS
jgi:flavorubredoxin